MITDTSAMDRCDSRRRFRPRCTSGRNAYWSSGQHHCTLSLLSSEARSCSGLRSIGVPVIAHNQRLDDMATHHLGRPPPSVRALLRGVSVSGQWQEVRGSALASYLMFEAPHTQELMALDEADTLICRDLVGPYFGWVRRRRLRGSEHPHTQYSRDEQVEPGGGVREGDGISTVQL